MRLARPRPLGPSWTEWSPSGHHRPARRSRRSARRSQTSRWAATTPSGTLDAGAWGLRRTARRHGHRTQREDHDEASQKGGTHRISLSRSEGRQYSLIMPVDVLAVDLGTGGPKVAVVSESGTILASAFVPVATRLLPGGGAEQDPEEWWQAVVSAARSVLERRRRRRRSHRRGGVHGAVVGHGGSRHRRCAAATRRHMDGLTGEPRHRAPDGRALNVLGYDVRKLARWIRLSGGVPGHSGKDPTAHILWIRDNEPDVYRATHKFLEPVDWLNQRLTGEFRASYDSIALHWVTDNRRIGQVRLRRRFVGHGRSGAVQAARSGAVGNHNGTAPARGGRATRAGGWDCRWSPAAATSIRPRSGRVRSKTARPTSTSGRRHGSRATSPFKKTDPCATWHRSPPPFPAGTWWPTSTRPPAHA